VNGDQVIRNQGTHERSEHGDHRWEVNIAEGKAPTARDVVQLISEVTVVAGDQQMPYEVNERESRQQNIGAGQD